MFIINESYHEYYSIIERANGICPRNKKKSEAKSLRGYVEDHHIVPICLGGADTIDNKVWLTAEEHIKCHKLLTDITENDANGKMWSALWRMMNKQSFTQERDFTVTAEEYSVARENHAKTHSTRMSGKMNPFYNKKHRDDTKKEMSLKKKGKSYEEIYGVDMADEMRARRSIEGKGKLKGSQTIVKCPHCEVCGGFGIMKRWHGDKCRSKPSTDIE